MGKYNEIDFIPKLVKVDQVPVDDVTESLLRGPFSHARCGDYLIDIAQVMNLLPQPPARLLDVGVGSGWTSELFARRGYEVLGLDVSPEMIGVARRRARRGLSFAVCDCEVDPVPGRFDAAVIYDSLHLAENEQKVVQSIFDALVEGGVLITVEPGSGDSRSADSLEGMRKHGTNGKDMPFTWQRELMLHAGFGQVDQYVRLSQVPVEEVSRLDGAMGQVRHAIDVGYGAATGATSIVVARKSRAGAARQPAAGAISGAMLWLSVLHDAHSQDIRSRLEQWGREGT